MTLSLKARLTLGHLAAVALVLIATALAANWAFSRAVLSETIDNAILTLAEAEVAALLATPTAAPRVHEVAPGTAAPSFARLDKFVQIVRPDGDVVIATGDTSSIRRTGGPIRQNSRPRSPVYSCVPAQSSASYPGSDQPGRSRRAS